MAGVEKADTDERREMLREEIESGERGVRPVEEPVARREESLSPA